MAEKRKLGSSNLSVTAVGLGCMGFSHAYGAPSKSKNFEEILNHHRTFKIGGSP